MPVGTAVAVGGAGTAVAVGGTGTAVAVGGVDAGISERVTLRHDADEGRGYGGDGLRSTRDGLHRSGDHAVAQLPQKAHGHALRHRGKVVGLAASPLTTSTPCTTVF